MNVRQVIEAFIGLDPTAEVEIVDTDGRATSLTEITHNVSNGQSYVCATIDERSTITERVSG